MTVELIMGIFIKAKVMLLDGPSGQIPVPKPSKTIQPGPSSKETKEVPKPRRPLQQPKVLEPKAALLLGHHHVPVVASPQLHMTHIPDKLMPIYMNSHEHQAAAINKRIDNTRAKEDERKRQQEMFEMLKIHQKLLYTIIATIGIPVVLLVLFYIEVGILVKCVLSKSLIFSCHHVLNFVEIYKTTSDISNCFPRIGSVFDNV